MKLSTTALSKIDELETRLTLALLFRVTERRVSQMIEANKPFGPLVSPKSLEIITQQTGLKKSEVLVNEKEAA